jgi:quercetin dioxygenase-like cupin family protein
MRPFLMIAAALLPAATMAQTASRPIPDAPTADPEHYTVEFENADVRVLRIKYPAHSKGNMHDHPHSVTVFLTAGKLRMTMPDGKSMVGNVPKGVAVFEEAGPHQPENIADSNFEAVRIELKR